MDRYAVIIDMGNTHSPIDEKLKTPDRLIEGCQSRVWLDATKDSEGHIKFTADSDALIVKGIIAMLVDVLSGHTPEEILTADLHFIHDIGLDEHLSPTRSNGIRRGAGINMHKHPRTTLLNIHTISQNPLHIADFV